MIETSIYSWLQLVSGYSAGNVIRANGIGPRPVGSHITWQVTSVIPDQGSKVISTRSGYNGVVTIYKHYTISLDINVYASDGMTVINNIARSNNDRRVRALLAAGNYAIKGFGSALDLSALDATYIRPRYMISAELYHADNNTYTDTNLYWDTYEITGTVQPADEEVIING